MTVINFQQAMEQASRVSFEPLPDGEYDLVCIESTPTESSTGKPMIKTRYQVESGPHAPRNVFNQYTFTADNDNALSFFFQHMGYHGLDQAFFAQNPSWEAVAAALVGRRVRVSVSTRVWLLWLLRFPRHLSVYLLRLLHRWYRPWHLRPLRWHLHPSRRHR